MSGVVKIDLINFALLYLLLIIVLLVMKKSKINQTKLLFLASFRMTIQLILAGLVLTYIFKNPHPVFTTLYIISMAAFSTYRVISRNKELNRKFKIVIGVSLTFTALIMIVLFVGIIVNVNIFNPQYTIPLSGMIFGNCMNGYTIGIHTFQSSLKTGRNQIGALQNIGTTPTKILMPFVNIALETALLPTMNSMLGMGIVSLPGMMTGQILAGTIPTTAVIYQIAIMIVICTTVCLSVFLALYFGQKTLYNSRNQMIFYE